MNWPHSWAIDRSFTQWISYIVKKERLMKSRNLESFLNVSYIKSLKVVGEKSDKLL